VDLPNRRFPEPDDGPFEWDCVLCRRCYVSPSFDQAVDDSTDHLFIVHGEVSVVLDRPATVEDWTV
jgi:hypothetical protein